MNMIILLGQISAQAEQAPSEKEMIQRVYEAANGLPAGGLKWILILSAISLVGIVWLVHRQQKLARNQVRIAAMLEDLAKQCGK